ncbi:MAG: hypothetical protein EBV06_02555 [Planctomycetia bacterium]|nr:hypothetical protein [Planctomycetia bacterium]
MRSKFLPRRPRIESLEERSVPATIQAVAGHLFVSKQVGALTVTNNGGGSVTVQDGAKTTTVTNIGNLILITGTNLSNNITFNGTTSFPGSVLINAGNGNDNIEIFGGIGGNLTVLGGLGNDLTTVTDNLDVGGTVNMVDVLGNNDLYITADMAVGGTMAARGFNEFALKVAGSSLSVGGDLTVSALVSGQPLELSTEALTAFNVGRNLWASGYANNDSVVIEGDLLVGGNTTVSLGGTTVAGQNDFNLTPDENNANTAQLAGNLYYTGGAGLDNVVLNNQTTVAGFTKISLGAVGSNTLDDNATHAGDVIVTGGNGGNRLTFGGVMDGMVRITLGNGTNNTTFNAAPAGYLVYSGGNLSDTVLLDGADDYYVDLLFGTAGTHQLTLETGSTISGEAKSGVPANSTFTNNGDIHQPFKINF